MRWHKMNWIDLEWNSMRWNKERMNEATWNETTWNDMIWWYELKWRNAMEWIEQTTWCILNEVATTSLHRLISFSSSFLLDWAYTLVTRKPGAFRKIYFIYIWNVLIRIHSSPETKKTWDGTLFKFPILWNQQAKKQRPFFFGGEAFKISEHKKWAMAPKTEPWPMGACLARAVDWRDGGFCSCFQDVLRCAIGILGSNCALKKMFPVWALKKQC